MFVSFLYLFLSAASHGVFDAITNGGLGVAFFSPFNTTRYFLPFRPVVVSPISIRRFFSGRGLEVLASEFRWIWLPSVAFASLATSIRRLGFNRAG
jgi:inner membrane protein